MTQAEFDEIINHIVASYQYQDDTTIIHLIDGNTIAHSMGIKDITLHYVTRSYMTRHGKGYLDKECNRSNISSDIQMDRTNHYNIFQDNFRYAPIDIKELSNRVIKDSSKYKSAKVVVDLTHCDEMDMEKEFRQYFSNVKTYDRALI